MYSTYTRLGVTVWSSDLSVIRAAYYRLHKLFRRDRDLRERRHAFYRQMLKYHHDAQKLCKEFAL